MTHEFHCRSCRSTRGALFIDLGIMPLANSYLASATSAEKTYPLRVFVCHQCFLVQTEDSVDATEIFSDYAYLSSYSDSWLAHAARYAQDMAKRLSLGPASHVVEVASNDGYLLRNFVTMGVPCLGIEPAANVAEIARAANVPTEVAFFGAETGRRLAATGRAADLMAANNVLAHVPDINDFVRGFRETLKPTGVATFEFPHLLNLIRETQFDTIYHEHFSYLSLLAVERCLTANDLMVFDVERLETHGGSLRLFVQRADSRPHVVTPRVAALRDEEARAQLDRPEAYALFAPRVERIRHAVTGFLAQAANDGKKVAAYGAAAKGNTLLNYCGVTSSQVAFCADRSTQKVGLFLPGSRIPVLPVDEISRQKPDYIWILPWNLTREITANLAFVSDWGGRFVTAIPELKVL